MPSRVPIYFRSSNCYTKHNRLCGKIGTVDSRSNVYERIFSGDENGSNWRNLITYQWRNDPDLSAKSDMDYVHDVIQSLTDHIYSNPKDYDAIFLRGNGYLDSGQYDLGIADYSILIDLPNPDERALNNRSLCWRGLGKFERGLEASSAAINLNPNYRDAINNRGMLYSDIDEHTKAITDFTRAIEIDPDYWYAYNNRAQSYLIMGDKSGAFSDYEKVRALLGH